ncbi:MAG: hypothetical protein J1E29_06225, partial [Duncaniella sp.]|nr:hypothetical protein [Duncaniella sp.]
MNHPHFAIKPLVILMAMMIGLFSAEASASAIVNPDSHLGRQLAAERHGRQFRGQTPFSVASATPLFAHPSLKKGANPNLSFENLPNYDYMEGPDGSSWFY